MCITVSKRRQAMQREGRPARRYYGYRPALNRSEPSEHQLRMVFTPLWRWRKR